MMPRSLSALLEGVIDYAGLYPPAELQLAAAISNFAGYKTGPKRWLVSRFVSPFSKLVEIEAYRETILASSRPNRFTVVGVGTGAELQELRRFNDENSGDLIADAVELKVPADLISAGGVGESLDSRREEFAGLETYAELHFQGAWESFIPRSIKEFAETRFARVKVRTGGTVASAFPSAAQLALVISECATHKLPLKATAGLHHPFRKTDSATGFRMHGFVNFLVASVFAWVGTANLEKVSEILLDECSASFRFGEDCLEWRDLSASLAQIQEARRFAVSFGSCSVDEPLDDLAMLGYTA